jgi:hypothetical protein
MAAMPLPLETMRRIADELDELFGAAPGAGYRAPRSVAIPALAERYADLAWQLGAAAPASLPPGSDDALRWLAHPVFVLGVPRSGTSLLRNLLDGHRELAVLPTEGNLLTQFRRPLRRKPYPERVAFLGRTWLARLVHGTNLPPYWLLGTHDETPNPYVAYARRLLAWAAANSVRRYGRPYDAFLPVVLAWASRDGGSASLSAWLEKTPYHEFELVKSLRTFPAAKCLHVIRDPRAILASRQTVELSVHGNDGDASLFAREIGRSLAVAAGFQRRLGPERYRVVRYEELAGEPEACMRGIADFLGIEFDPALLRPTVAGRDTASNSSHAGPADAGVVLPAHGEARCDAAALTLLRRHAGRAAAHFGYTLN